VNDQRVPIPGSDPKHKVGARWSSGAEPNQPVGATIILRRPGDSNLASKQEQELLSGHFRPMPREQAAQALAADPNDIAAVRSFLQQYGLTIVEENPDSRTIRVRGTAQQMEQAFGIRLRLLEDDKQQCLSYEGSISVPKSLAGVIVAVLGLDQRPVAQHHIARDTAQ
jgi:kumamolisin